MRDKDLEESADMCLGQVPPAQVSLPLANETAPVEYIPQVLRQPGSSLGPEGSRTIALH